jgi:predicted PurR-regulated permease PerM
VSEDGPDTGHPAGGWLRRVRQLAVPRRGGDEAPKAGNAGKVRADGAARGAGADGGADPAPAGALETAQQAQAARAEAAILAEDTAEPRADAADHPDAAADRRSGAERSGEGVRDARSQAADLRDEVAHSLEGAEQARVDATEARDQARRARDEAVGAVGDPVVDEEVRDEEAGVDEDNPLGRPGRPLNRRSPLRIGFSAAVGAGLAYLLYRALVNAQSVLVLVLVAAFLAIGLNPTVTRLERTGMRRGVAVGIVCLAVLAFFVAFGYAVLPPVVQQVANFVEAVPGYVRDLQNNSTIRDLDSRFGLVRRLNDYVTGDLGRQVATNIVSIGQTLAGLVFKAVTILILTLYFLSSFNKIKDTAYRLVPRSRRARVTLISDEILSRVGGYVAGAAVVALIAGTATLVWVSALGIPYPLALALIVTLTDVIPLIGATIGAIIVTTVAFFVSVPVGIATAIFFILYQQAENYVIYPRVMSRSVDINPAAAIVGALVGGTLLGFVGALLAVPATAAIQLILREVLVPRQDAQ